MARKAATTPQRNIRLDDETWNLALEIAGHFRFKGRTDAIRYALRLAADSIWGPPPPGREKSQESS